MCRGLLLYCLFVICRCPLAVTALSELAERSGSIQMGSASKQTHQRGPVAACRAALRCAVPQRHWSMCGHVSCKQHSHRTCTVICSAHRLDCCSRMGNATSTTGAAAPNLQDTFDIGGRLPSAQSSASDQAPLFASLCSRHGELGCHGGAAPRPARASGPGEIRSKQGEGAMQSAGRPASPASACCTLPPAPAEA